jgi:hypothetical protein
VKKYIYHVEQELRLGGKKCDDLEQVFFIWWNKYIYHVEQKLISGGTKDVMTWNKYFDLVEQIFIINFYLVGKKDTMTWNKCFLFGGTNIYIYI